MAVPVEAAATARKGTAHAPEELQEGAESRNSDPFCSSCSSCRRCFEQLRVDRPPLPWSAAGLSFLEAQPSRRYQTIQQIAGLIGIKAPAQGLAANILERNHGQAIGLNPPQGAAEVLVTVGQSDLAQGGARVWPKVFAHQLDGIGH